MNGNLTNEEKQWAMFCHLSVLSGFIIPFGNIVGPLVLWLLKREQSPYVDYHGKEALNFQISITIYLVISGILVLVLIGIVFLIVILLLDIILMVMAAIKASEGVYYRYPFTMRFIQ